MVKNKKKFGAQTFGLIALSLMLVASLVLGLTGAWFTDTKDNDATVTFGIVKLETEGFTINVDASNDYLPGDVIESLGDIDYIGNVDAYYRISYKFTDATVGGGTVFTGETEDVYGKIAPSVGAKITLKDIEIPTTLGNAYNTSPASTITIEIKIDVIQQANVLSTEEVAGAIDELEGAAADAAEARAAFDKLDNANIDYTTGVEAAGD